MPAAGRTPVMPWMTAVFAAASLASAGLVRQVRGAGDYHINADEPESVGYAAGNQPGPWRSSDHDPLLLGLDL